MGVISTVGFGLGFLLFGLGLGLGLVFRNGFKGTVDLLVRCFGFSVGGKWSVGSYVKVVAVVWVVLVIGVFVVFSF